MPWSGQLSAHLCLDYLFYRYYSNKSVSRVNGFYGALPFSAAAPRNNMTPTSSPPAGFTHGTRDTLAQAFPPPSGRVSQADATPHLTAAPSGAPDTFAHLSTLNPLPSQESKVLGSRSTADSMVVFTTPARDSSVSQHCKWALNTSQLEILHLTSV